jgi:hypothetical protein
VGDEGLGRRVGAVVAHIVTLSSAAAWLPKPTIPLLKDRPMKACAGRRPGNKGGVAAQHAVQIRS